MTKAERRAEFDKRAEGSVELGRDLIQNVLKWTEYIPESEFSTQDHAALMDVFWELYRIVQPMNERYIDGDEESETPRRRKVA